MRANKLCYLFIALMLGMVSIGVSLGIEKYVRDSLDTTIHYNYESGFYDEPIDIEISTGGSYFITYTLDGTDPTINSERYEGPIHIIDASEHENVWSMWKESSPGFFNEKSIYALPSEKVDKCTVVRATAFDYSGNAVSSSLKEYFIGYKNKVGYDNLYTVCVFTEPIYLFEDNIGIYTMGSGMRDFIDSGEADEHDWESDWKKAREANWFKDGIQSERAATVQVFNKNNELVLDVVCGIRVRGHDSRHDPQKSLGLYSREEYSGLERFEYDFFDDGIGPHSFVVFNSGDDSDVKIKDYIIHKLEKEAGSEFSTSTFIPCNLFLQGEYWGPMYIMEDLNDEFLSTQYGVSSDNIRLLKANTLKASDIISENSTDEEDWKELVDFIKSNDMSLDENYNYVCSQMDIDSFVDYAATEIYVGNSNWKEKNNSAEWRAVKSEANNKYSDGRWRFCLYDVNDTLTDWGDETPTFFKRALDFQPMVRRLAKNKEFEALFRDRIEELTSIYTRENVDKCIDEWRATMQIPVDCYFKRFANKPGVENFSEEEIAGIYQFVENRPAQMEILFEQMFK